MITHIYITAEPSHVKRAYLYIKTASLYWDGVNKLLMMFGLKENNEGKLVTKEGLTFKEEALIERHGDITDIHNNRERNYLYFKIHADKTPVHLFEIIRNFFDVYLFYGEEEQNTFYTNDMKGQFFSDSWLKAV